MNKYAFFINLVDDFPQRLETQILLSNRLCRADTWGLSERLPRKILRTPKTL